MQPRPLEDILKRFCNKTNQLVAETENIPIFSLFIFNIVWWLF